jgi:ATP-dependent DNA helicase RecG
MMRTAEDLWKELIALDESHRIEAKQARQVDRSIMETICAFANEPGLGSGSRTYYVPGPRFLTAQRVPVPAVVSATSNSHQPVQNSHQPVQNSHQPNLDSHQLLATIPAELADRIPPAGSKPRRDILRALIIDLCRWRALSARELAIILNDREHKPLVRDYLSPMVGEGAIAYTIPAMENHPDQRYTAPIASTEDIGTTS